MSRGKRWTEMPSSSDLAALMKCEVEFVHERSTGRVREDAGTRAASQRGEVAHLQAQKRMETFHNRPAPAPAAQRGAGESARDSRCFVASAVYGGQAPQTERLREFRDQVLVRRRPGRILVRAYYGLSPPVAGLLVRHRRAAWLVRRVLDVFLRLLSARGRGGGGDGGGGDGGARAGPSA